MVAAQVNLTASAIQPSLTAERCTLRAMRLRDLVQVSAIERHAYAFPWSQENFSDCLTAGYRVRVLDHKGEICGYSVVSLVPGEAHLLNLCISPAWQRRGCGRYLLNDVITAASGSACEAVWLEVRQSNRKALKLYRQMGFDIVGVRKDYYRSSQGPMGRFSQRPASRFKRFSRAPSIGREHAWVLKLQLARAGSFV
ncbi:MAG: ribosomal protein S18-alanine N-acetyltransferase [Gammaproteobacteria bacterium]|nr:ribosomal protein S18-alanine N-acetyltransferase [Gammaproteobacteria bacterium]